MSSETVTDFTTVDSSKDPQFFLRFLEAANKLPTMAASKQMILDGLRLRNGSRALVIRNVRKADRTIADMPRADA